MTKQELQELNKELAEWAEFGSIIITEYNIEAFTPNGWAVMLHFTNSLDACFKWLVPKLKRLGFILYIHEYKKGWLVNFLWLEDIGYKRRQRVTSDKYESVAETPALALCLAIKKLIDKEKK